VWGRGHPEFAAGVERTHSGELELRRERPVVVPRFRDQEEGLMATETRQRVRPKPPKVHRNLRDRLQKSFLERNSKVIGAIGVLLVLGFTILALLLQGGFLTGRYTVHAIFADAAGVQVGDRVSVAGLTAGRVNGVNVEGGHVVMDLGVDNKVKLTRDTTADIKIETLLGRRSVELVDGSSSKPLEDGQYIPLSSTSTPVDITNLNDVSVNLLNKSHPGALNALLKEVTRITSGKATQIRTIITGLQRITTAVDERRVQLGQLLDALRTVSTTLGGRDQTLVSLVDNLNVVLSNLAQRQQALAELLRSTDTASHQTADLVSRNRTVLNSTLNFLHEDLEVLSRHQLDLAAAVDYLDTAVKGYSSVGYSSGGFPNKWANIFVQSLGPVGVDALLGKCGTVDHLFDYYFGTNCGKTALGPVAPRIPTRISTGQGMPAALPRLPNGPNLPALPCTVDNLVQSALGQSTRCSGS
jgi:phospholipid/cholesterol/gamma-HCH transport system substrate-binding protein